MNMLHMDRQTDRQSRYIHDLKCLFDKMWNSLYVHKNNCSPSPSYLINGTGTTTATVTTTNTPIHIYSIYHE